MLTRLWRGLRHRTIVALCCLIGFVPSYVTLAHGQSSVIALCLLILVKRELEERRYGTAGIVAGMLAYKPQLAAVILPHFVFAYPQTLLSVLASTGGCVAVSVFLVPDLFVALPRFLVWYQTSPDRFSRVPQAMVSFQGFFENVANFMNRPSTYLEPVVASCALLCATARAILRRHRSDPAWTISIIVDTALLSGWHVHVHDLTVTLFALAALSRCSSRRTFHRVTLTTWFGSAFSFYSLLPAGPTPFLPTLLCILLWCALLLVPPDDRGNNCFADYPVWGGITACLKPSDCTRPAVPTSSGGRRSRSGIPARARPGSATPPWG